VIMLVLFLFCFIRWQVRGRGLIAAVELVADRASRAPFPASAAVGTFFCSAAR